MADPNPTSSNHALPSSHNNEPENDEEVEEPSLTYFLEPDNGQEQLLRFNRSSCDKIPVVQAYDADRQQQLAEGSLSDSRFNARLKRVTFGTYRSHSACLLVIAIIFQSSNAKRWLRFRDATIDIEFNDEHVEEDKKPSADISVMNNSNTRYKGPYVTKFYPEVIYGTVPTVMEQFGFEFSVPPYPPAVPHPATL